MNMSLQITDGLSGLLHQKEGWESPPSPRLPEAECDDSEECLTPAPDTQHMVSEAKAKYFTKLDIWWGYNNIRIKE